MVFLSGDPKAARPIARFLRVGTAPSWADLIAFLLLAAAAILIVRGADDMGQSLAVLRATPVTLEPARLPEYALRTTLRMFLALFASLVFTFTIATLAAKSRKAELIIVPALDILQSVPVLGFLTFTVTFFMGLFPGRQLGVECAAIFAIFTSQAWNMAFSFYQSLRSIPSDLDEVSRQFAFSPWRRFVRLELPFATPSLVWNVMMSMSGGWFFVVASEAITVGNHSIILPGIGAYLAQAISDKNVGAIGWVILAMTVVILAYDQLLFRPLVAWADKFRMENTSSGDAPESWLLDLVRRTRLIHQLLVPAGWLLARAARLPFRLPSFDASRFALPRVEKQASRAADIGWAVLVLIGTAYVVWRVVSFVATGVTLAEVGHVFLLGLATLLRVLVLIALASLVWVPIGVWIGLRPRWAARLQALAQFLAAFPANLMFPVAVGLIVRERLDPDLWLSPLMVLGTQWYLLFNVIAGASTIPAELRDAADNLGLTGWLRWRRYLLPAVFPSFVTGALTASGGSWNASIVAESVSWGTTTLQAHGLGAYIAQMTAAGDFPRIALGIGVMCVFVMGLNQLLWRRLYRLAEGRMHA